MREREREREGAAIQNVQLVKLNIYTLFYLAFPLVCTNKSLHRSIKKHVQGYTLQCYFWGVGIWRQSHYLLLDKWIGKLWYLTPVVLCNT